MSEFSFDFEAPLSEEQMLINALNAVKAEKSELEASISAKNDRIGHLIAQRQRIKMEAEAAIRKLMEEELELADEIKPTRDQLKVKAVEIQNLENELRL